MSQEKRTYIRVAARLRAMARKVSSPKAEHRFTGGLPAGVSSGRPDLKGSGVSEGLADYLTEINNKLDMLLSLTNQERLKEDFPIQALVTEISGAGVRFKAAAKLEEGSHLEMVVVLSEFPLRMAGGIGKIVRREDLKKGADYSLEFTSIRERDTEAIVQFGFDKQREDIREKKWS